MLPDASSEGGLEGPERPCGPLLDLFEREARSRGEDRGFVAPDTEERLQSVTERFPRFGHAGVARAGGYLGGI